MSRQTSQTAPSRALVTPARLAVVFFLTLILAATTVRSESRPTFYPDTVSEKSQAPDRGFIPPNFSTAHISNGVAGNFRPDKVLPESYDCRPAGQVSPVKNQGSCGACYAFGTAADIESRLLMDGQGLFDVSENNIKECNYQDASCWGGNQYMTISYLSREGVVLESCDPYVANDTACVSGCNPHFTVLDWIQISGSTTPNPDVLKQYLMDYGPVHTSVFAGDDSEPVFRSQFNNYNGSGALYFTGGNTPNHSVFLVGWDDDIVHPGGTGAWIVKNSWGTNWGGTCGYGASRGYFYIAYGSASIGQYSSVIREYMVTDDNFDLLSHDEGGFNTSFSAGSATIWGLSSLTAAEDTYLHRVEFWTTDVTVDVDVYVYGAFNGTTASNLLASRFDQSYSEPGYHYVQLNEPLALNAGQTVHIAVKFGNQSYTFPLAGDGEGPVDSGKNFVSTNGLSWSNLAAYGVDTTIRARVSTDTALSVDDPDQDLLPGGQLPMEFRLDSAYPNPFNPSTTIEYSLHRTGTVNLKVYDLKGVVVRVLVAEQKSAGSHQVVWDGRDDQGQPVASGLYFCRADSGFLASSLKLVLLK